MSLRHFLRRAPAVTAAEALGFVGDGALIVDVRRDFGLIDWRAQGGPLVDS